MSRKLIAKSLTCVYSIARNLYIYVAYQACRPSNQAIHSLLQASLQYQASFTMVALTLGIFFTSLAASAVAPKPEVVKRASSCTFSGSNGAAEASKSQSSCATMVLSDVAVPSGTTLDLSSLADGTTVIFEGTTTWGYSEWKGPLLDIQGKKITVKGAEGSVLNGDGARWWDGKGGNGGKTKPKFFSAHKLTDSTITGITIKNPPVQVVSINGCDGLTITDMTIDASDGDKDEQGHNTDGFDIGSSNNVIIDGAKVYNQDDCVAVNSGTVSNDMKLRYSHLLTSRLGNHLQERPLLRWTRSIHWLGWWS